MSALGIADLQNNATAYLESQSEQPVRPSVMPPLSGKLNVDENLKLSRQNFKQLIEEFYRDKDITPLSQLTATSPFPTPRVLAHFASKTYTVYKRRETDTQYESRLALPDGWKLLTTASNSSKTNGYFGAAYWHREHQQVVIAHRGTNFKILGAQLTDVAGVLFKNHAPQIESASTFAHKVVEVLREANQEKGTNFHLFFTGHSLGGWLAHITTFTTEYLKREVNIFIKNNNDQDCFHPHTVVFDSPGCKNMLLQMKDDIDVRVESSIDIEHLDITSYLSAPNPINTCNAHLGTIYRIFPDRSDMVWWKKCTASYNIATHSMDKIMEAFDPDTGQVYKDEQGQLKVQVVIDWPICAGLKRVKEYKKFFEWAQHLNNYHPDIKDVSFQHLCPIRYQTKLYDERVNSLSVFSQEEQEFLQRYGWLRQWPEFFQPQELFSVIEDSQAQADAEKILQSFEIGSDKIRCKDAVSLQALVPYVKRLLHLFPEIKEIGNGVLQCETRSCVQRIRQSPLEFNSDASRIREFLESKKQKVLHLQMIQGNEWIGLIKLYQLLQKTNCLNEGQYTVLKLESMLTLNKLLDFSTLRLPTHLILVVCEATEHLKEETANMIRKVFETMKKEPFIKIILTTRSEDRTAHFLQNIGRKIFGNGFITRDEYLTWSDLTFSSQEKLLEISVKFQGACISLNELMSAESPVANFLPLGAIMEGKELKIADPLQIANDYSEYYYIERTLRHQKAIKQDIFSDKYVKEKLVFLPSTEQEFKQLCQLNPTSNVHWLEKDKSGKLVWQQSQGSLKTLREYTDTDSSHTYTAHDLDMLLEQAQHQRVVLISDTAGMGKSTLLAHLSKQIKQKFPAKWVVRIDLHDHTDALSALEEQMDMEKAIEFVSEKVLKLKPGLEMELFKQCCEQKQKVGVVIMLDGFDEISPFYKDNVIDLLQILRQTAAEQLWITTRPHLRAELEDTLQQMSYTLEPFSEENQAEFLIKFWSLKFPEMNIKEVEASKRKLVIYAKN